ncbi:MAG: GFA family protein [Gammaproteobacteria bacterium]|nr:GFA family protein [Gammaproteobacteria bacterium]MDH3446982.1 GFA family protein [Gammaproteobacteria bacterium]
MKDAKLSGHCYCGAIRFEINGASDWVGHCHCESCRRASGSVMTTFAGFRPDQVVFTGAMPNRYTTADGVTRSFCGQCGSPVAYENAQRPDEIHLQLGLFDQPERLPPQNHSFLEEKVDWLHADEHLPASGWTQDPDSN